jgi:hypothetical protein
LKPAASSSRETVNAEKVEANNMTNALASASDIAALIRATPQIGDITKP